MKYILYESYIHDKRILLTSTGFDNKNIEKVFLSYIRKKPEDIKCLFIPTAAIDKESREIIPLCYKELTDLGIKEDNIVEYNLDSKMSVDQLNKFDAIYVCGGSEVYLMNQINKIGMRNNLISAVNNGLFYIGVSAGAMIGSSSVKNSLNFISNPLEPHCEKDTTNNGPIEDENTEINISDNQAVWIYKNKVTVIE